MYENAIYTILFFQAENDHHFRNIRYHISDIHNDALYIDASYVLESREGCFESEQTDCIRIVFFYRLFTFFTIYLAIYSKRNKIYRKFNGFSCVFQRHYVSSVRHWRIVQGSLIVTCISRTIPILLGNVSRSLHCPCLSARKRPSYMIEIIARGEFLSYSFNEFVNDHQKSIN